MMVRSRTALLAFTALAGLGTFVACGHKSDTSASGDGDSAGGSAASTPNTAELQDNAQVMNKSQIDSVDSSQTDRLIWPSTGFTDLLNLSAGTVLIGDRMSPTGTGKNAHGFLRTVVSATSDANGNVVVMTSTATLMQAAKKFDFQATLQSPQLTMTGPATQSAKVAPGFRTEGGGTPIKLLDFSNTKLLDVTDNLTLSTTPEQTIGFHAFATVTTGTLDFTPTFDIGGHFDASSVINGILGDGTSLGDAITFHANATGTLDADVELDLGVQLMTTLDNASFTQLVAQKIFQSKSATLADYPFDLGSLSLGPIGLPVSADFKAVLTCDFAFGGGAEVKVGAKASGSVTVGVTYQNSQLTPSFDHSQSFTEVGPTWTADGLTKARCTVKPEFTLNLFDKAMADIWAEGVVAVGADLTCDSGGSAGSGGSSSGGSGGSSPDLTGTLSGNAYAGLSAGLDVHADIFGIVKFDKECVLFSVQSDDNKFSESFPLPSGPNASCTPGTSGLDPEPAADPTSCFTGSGDPGDVKNGTQDGGVIDGCVPVNDAGGAGVSPPDGWTCDAGKFGDCMCDCGCGAPDIDCDDGTCSGCAHDECTVGDPLGNSCDDCTSKVCAADPYCCDQYWGISCFDDVKNLCGKTCDESGSGGSGM